jgi:hypothetical protein
MERLALIGRVCRRWVCLGTALVAAACGGGGGGTPTSPAPAPVAATYRGQASDGSGDALSDPRLRVPPDLTQTTVTAANGTLTISVRFAPGTFDRATLSTQVLMDTDQVISTGLPGIGSTGPDGGVIGADMLLNVEPTESYLLDCRILRQGECNPGSAVTGTVFVADGFDATVSLSLLGDDGRLSFKVLVGGIFGSGRSATYTDDLDVMPDVGRPATRVE